VIDARAPVAKLSMDEQLSGIDFAALFGQLFDSKRLTGRGNAKATLSGRGNDSNTLLGSLDGRIEFNAENGAFQGTDLWYEIQRAQALFAKQPATSQPNTGETRFKALQGSATVTKGVLENRDLTFDMDYLKVTGAGTLGLQSQKVDYRLNAKVFRMPKESAAAAADTTKSAETTAAAPAGTTPAEPAPLKTAVEIPVQVSGTLADLKIRPDMEALAKSQAKGKVEEQKKKLEEKLSDKLSDWLGKRKN